MFELMLKDSGIGEGDPDIIVDQISGLQGWGSLA